MSSERWPKPWEGPPALICNRCLNITALPPSIMRPPAIRCGNRPGEDPTVFNGQAICRGEVRYMREDELAACAMGGPEAVKAIVLLGRVKG